MAATESLVLNDVTKIFQQRGGAGVVKAVDRVSLTIRKGEFVTLLGPSGCGKTTTLRLIAGFEMPSSGRIVLDGTDITYQPPNKRDMAMVFQSYALFPHMNVFDNVAYGLRIRKLSRSDIQTRVENALALVGLSGLGNRKPNQLSGGQQQRVALARALAPQPDLVMLDEPFSNLDQKLRVSVRREVKQILSDAGATAILVTHDQEEALSLADRIVVMNRGRAEQVGAPEELYHRPASRFVASFIGDAQFLRGEARDRIAHTLIGDVPLVNESHGPVDVLLRPEHVRLERARSETSGRHGTVVAREYFGHHQLLTVAIDAGHSIVARLGAYSGIRPGDGVWVSVRGAMMAFPPEAGEGPDGS